MKYKLVAMDCDGTLLDSRLNLPKKNEEVIRKLSKKGIKFIIATGRNDKSVKEYIEQLEITAPIIGCNGASIRDINKNIVYSLYPIDEKPLRELWDYFVKENLTPQYFNIDSYYCHTQENIDEIKEMFKEFDAYSVNLFTSFVAESFETLRDKKILKVIFNTEIPGLQSKVQEDLSRIKGINAVRSSKTCIDIVAENVSKGNALLEYIKGENIKPEEVIAIGDSENDYSMLKSVGFSITFENGDSLLKEFADYITVSNNEAGLGIALETVFGLK